MTTHRLIYLSSLILVLTLSFGCGSDDDSNEGGNICQAELVSVTELGDQDFTVTLKNTSSAAVTYGVDVRYLDNGVQKNFTGIGVSAEVDPGTTVEIETVSGEIFTRDDYDCAQILLTIFPTSGSVFCQEGQIGQDCY